MPATLIIPTQNPSIKQERIAWATRVFEYFGDTLPKRQLLVYLDDEDWREFRNKLGTTNRGFLPSQ
jgi:hypothetical protein